MAAVEIPFEELVARYASDSSVEKDEEIEDLKKEDSKGNQDQVLSAVCGSDSEEEDETSDQYDVADWSRSSNKNIRFLNQSDHKSIMVQFPTSDTLLKDCRVGPKHMQPLKNALHKLDAHLKIGDVSYTPSEEIQSVNVDARVDGHLRESEKKRIKTKIRVTDKSDRATVDSVLDKRTRTILLKLLNRGVFSEIYGVISTGKEANVYHAVDGEGTDLAIKIYKTSILGFRDRDRYVSGDYRFRKGYSRGNPRKMVATWAEKEMRNLNRLVHSGILSPRPIEQKMHVLVMQFIGADGQAALRLKDAVLTHEQSLNANRELCLILWKLYSQCKLVHADFSEYNILYYQEMCYLIDVSQSVDLDHPLSLDFLRQDCACLIEFFQKAGIATLTLRELCDFVTDPSVTRSNVDQTLDKLLEIANERWTTDEVKEDESEVFKHAFLPRRLEEVIEYERDIEQVQKGKKEGIYYQTIMGLTEDLSGVQLVPKVIENEQTNESSSSATTETDMSEDEPANPNQKRVATSREEIKAERKENKKSVKEANRERRKTKMPKHVKKQLTRKGKNKR